MFSLGKVISCTIGSVICGGLCGEIPLQWTFIIMIIHVRVHCTINVVIASSLFILQSVDMYVVYRFVLNVFLIGNI
jgi:hypothetical protein